MALGIKLGVPAFVPLLSLDITKDTKMLVSARFSLKVLLQSRSHPRIETDEP